MQMNSTIEKAKGNYYQILFDQVNEHRRHIRLLETKLPTLNGECRERAKKTIDNHRGQIAEIELIIDQAAPLKKSKGYYPRPVVQLFGEQEIAKFRSAKEASEQSGVRLGGIQKTLSGHQRMCGGYGWRYA